MAEQQQTTLFRKKAMERISSPEQLTEYLRVTNPGIWVILVAVILLLAGVFAWSTVGTLETKAEVKVIVADHTAQVVPFESEVLTEGMTLRVDGKDYLLNSADTDEYGRTFGTASVNLPEGTYDGTVVTEAKHPIKYLLMKR